MDSDTDSECELPPGWEKCISKGHISYFNHINKTNQTISPLKALEKRDHFVNESYNKRSCGFSRGKLKSIKFVQNYDSFSTAEQITAGADLSLKYAVVIGGCSGIGLELVHHLVQNYCFVILGVPDITRCNSDLSKKIKTEDISNYITVFHLDLSNFKSSKLFCELVLKTINYVNIIILSAGVMCPPYCITVDGFESTFQINVLSQYYIIETLLQKFAFGDCHCRVVWLTCESHRAVTTFNPFQLYPSSVNYDGYYAYALSSLCKIIIIKQWKKKWDMIDCAYKPLFFACHPGNVVYHTNITRYHSYLKFIFWMLSPFTKNLNQACATPILCCLSNSTKTFSGNYFNNCCICEPSELAYNEKNGKLLMQYLTNKLQQINLI